MDIKKQITAASNFLQKNDLDNAKRIYESILKKVNDNAEIHYNLGLIYKTQNDLEKAESHISKSILTKPNFIFAHYQLGNTKYKLKKFNECEMCYQKAISLNPKFLEAYINLARTQRELRNFKDAENNLRIAYKLDPDFVEVNVLLGLILFDRGRFTDDLKFQDIDKLNEAKKLLLKSIKLNSNYSFAHQNLGLVQQELGDLNSAKDSFKKALKLDPNSVYANQNLNIVLNQIKLINEVEVKNRNVSNFLKTFKEFPIVTYKKPNKKIINLLYKINSIDLNKTKGGPLFGNGTTSDYNLFENNNNKLLDELKIELIDIVKNLTQSKVFFIDSFFNILSAGGGSVAHHHLNGFDKTFNLENRKYSLTYYLSVGDQNCEEPGIFKMYEPKEEVLPSEGMIMIIPSARKHSAVYSGKTDRVMIGVNFYIY